MKVHLLAFATARDALESGEAAVELPEGSRVADLKTLLERRHPGLGELWPRLAVAVGGELATLETVLHEGDEVALLPPVSGGGRSRRGRLTTEPIQVDALVEEVSAPERGAVLVFLGTVRGSLGERRVEGLDYDAYRPLAERSLARIALDLEREWKGLRVAIVHRLGELSVGEVSVAIVAASPHRAAAYEASRQALERLKQEVPIWKRERFADGEAVWREVEPLSPSS